VTSETETLVYWFDRANVAEAKLAAANARALVSEDENAELSRERLALREQLGQVLQRRASEYPYGIQVSAVVETLWPLIEQALAAAEAKLAAVRALCVVPLGTAEDVSVILQQRLGIEQDYAEIAAAVALKSISDCRDEVLALLDAQAAKET